MDDGRDGQWTMDYGQWTMDDGRWTMDNGQWTMDYGLWSEYKKSPSRILEGLFLFMLFGIQAMGYAPSSIS
jgi:hypothetical protein